MLEALVFHSSDNSWRQKPQIMRENCYFLSQNQPNLGPKWQFLYSRFEVFQERNPGEERGKPVIENLLKAQINKINAAFRDEKIDSLF